MSINDVTDCPLTPEQWAEANRTGFTPKLWNSLTDAQRQWLTDHDIKPEPFDLPEPIPAEEFAERQQHAIAEFEAETAAGHFTPMQQEARAETRAKLKAEPEWAAYFDRGMEDSKTDPDYVFRERFAQVRADVIRRWSKTPRRGLASKAWTNFWNGSPRFRAMSRRLSGCCKPSTRSSRPTKRATGAWLWPA